MHDQQGQDLVGDDFSDYCVLLVEDDEIMRISLEDRLLLDGICVHAVGALSREAELQLQSMPFPGNVRELRNIIERAVALCDAPWISPSELLSQDDDNEETGTTTLKKSIEVAERKAILNALVENEHKISQAAASLGISRKNLWE